MANTANFSPYYKARVVKAIVSSSRTLHAFSIIGTGKTPGAPVSATCTVTPTTAVLGSVANGSIPFAGIPTAYNTTGAELDNSGASAQLTIPAGHVVHYVGLATAANVLLTYVTLTLPDTNYYYEEQGTLTIPAGGYTVRHA